MLAAGARIAPDALGAGTNLQAAKARELDVLARHQRRAHHLKHAVGNGRNISLAQTGLCGRHFGQSRTRNRIAHLSPPSCAIDRNKLTLSP